MRTTLPHTWREATTYNERPPGTEVDMLVLHYTGMVTAEASIDRLCDPDIAVSCQYMVDLEGNITQMVEEHRRAYQAGVSLWRGVEDNNGRSIGIEIQNKGQDWGYHDFPGAQMAAVEVLCLDILSRHPIPQRNVVGHSDIAPGRKVDPGEKFDWRRLGEAGVGLWVEPAPVEAGQYFQVGDSGEPVEALQTMFAVYGYGIEPSGNFDQRTHDIVYAFQQHWRQERCDGVADVSTIKTLKRVVDAIPDEER